MIYTVTFNPSLDYVLTIEDFQVGELNRSKSESIYPGGKGLNVSMVLSELGVRSTALGFVGGFTGEELQKRLQEKGVCTDFISVRNGNTRINVKIQNNETEINAQGPEVSEEEINDLMVKISNIKTDDVLVVSGSVSKGVSSSIYADILKLCNKKHVNVIVDASSALLWNTLEYAPFLIKPNHHELGDIFNREIQSQDEMIFYAKELQNRGARNVLVSAGKKGAVLVAEDGNIYEMEAPEGTVINPVGAGDSMVAGFIAEYFRSYDYEKALKLGICSGSATAFSEGLAKKEDIERLLFG